MPIRVIAVDDHPLILKAISDLLKGFSDILLVATSQQGSMLLELVRDYYPDVAIIDLGMADLFDPISTVRLLHDQHPNVKILILTGYNDGLWVRELTKAGANGYMLKSDDFSLNIPQAIQALYEGRNFYSAGVADKLIENDLNKLTSREISVLNLLSQGLSTVKIADDLGVTEKRVQNVLGIIGDKLGVDRTKKVSLRVTTIKKARELGLLPKE